MEAMRAAGWKPEPTRLLVGTSGRYRSLLGFEESPRLDELTKNDFTNRIQRG